MFLRIRLHQFLLKFIYFLCAFVCVVSLVKRKRTKANVVLFRIWCAYGAFTIWLFSRCMILISSIKWCVYVDITVHNIIDMGMQCVQTMRSGLSSPSITASRINWDSIEKGPFNHCFICSTVCKPLLGCRKPLWGSRVLRSKDAFDISNRQIQNSFIGSAIDLLRLRICIQTWYNFDLTRLLEDAREMPLNWDGNFEFNHRAQAGQTFIDKRRGNWCWC